MTVSTFHPSNDAYMYLQASSWANARAGTGTGPTVDTSTPHFDGIDYLSTTDMYVMQGFYDFDTAALPNGDTVSAAVFSLFGTSAQTPNGQLTLRVKGFDFGNSIGAADFRNATQWAALTQYGTFDTAGWSTSAYNDFTSDAAFLTGVSLTGNTRVVVHTSLYESSTDPNNNTIRSMTCSSSAEAGTTQDPKLVVTHAAAGGQATPELAGRPFGRRGQNHLHQALAF